MAAFRGLTAAEQRAVLDCMTAILNGPYIADEEFETRLGIDRAELAGVVSAWPDLDDADPVVRLAINNSLNEALNGVGVRPAEWARRSSTSVGELRGAFRRWKELLRPSAP